jgi:hypothetical protein
MHLVSAHVALFSHVSAQAVLVWACALAMASSVLACLYQGVPSWATGTEAVAAAEAAFPELGVSLAGMRQPASRPPGHRATQRRHRAPPGPRASQHPIASLRAQIAHARATVARVSASAPAI